MEFDSLGRQLFTIQELLKCVKLDFVFLGCCNMNNNIYSVEDNLF